MSKLKKRKMSKSVARFSDRLPTKMGPLRQWLALDRHCYGSLTLIDCSQVRYSTRRRLWGSVVPEHIIPEGTTACLCRRLENETKWKKRGEKQQQNNRTQTGTLRANTEMEASRVKYSTFKRNHSNSRSFERKKPANSQQKPEMHTVHTTIIIIIRPPRS
jgi:hypothetical protein